MITEYGLEHSGNSLDFTRNAAVDIKKLIWDEEFEDKDSEIIYNYLYNNIRIVSFSDYLKRYIYEKAELKGSYSDIDNKVYQDIIIGSFHDTGTPKSFHKTSLRLPVMINSWLTQQSVNRRTIFLLGFGLSMTVEDVTDFLTKVIREHDFNFNNPEEVIYWFSIKNHYNAQKAIDLVREYEELPPDDSGLPFENRTVAVRNHAQTLPEDELLAFLRKLKSVHRDYPFSVTSHNEFVRLLDESKEIILKMNEESGEFKDGLSEPSVSAADIERTIYNGVPLNQKGNLEKASASRLTMHFASKRLSRQRIDLITGKKIQVDRSDLITLNFFVHSYRSADKTPNERFHSFLADMNDILEKCYMGEMNIANPYEAFILMCLLTEWPMATFNEVWEYSYETEAEA